MQDEDAIIPKIEAYLNGLLLPNEALDFENQMAADPALGQLVEEYRLLFSDLALVCQRQQLKSQLEGFHTAMLQKEAGTSKTLRVAKTSKPGFATVLLKKYVPTFLVAASIAVLSVLSTMWVLNNNVRSIEQKQKTDLLSLRRDLNRVKEEQAEIARSQREKQTSPPVRQYGATAFVLTSSGYLVTNYHVVKDADSIYVESERQNDRLHFKVQVVYSDPAKDLAILKIVDDDFIGFAELPYTLRTEEANLGESVFTLAYPRQEMVYGEGSISAQSGYLGDTLTYQISIPVNPGNSGGPLLDAQGNLIGIVSGKHLEMEGAAFAVKAKHLKADLDSLAKQDQSQALGVPSKSRLSFLSRPEQIKLLKDFVFVVRVYNGK
ncbi:MAG: hypothetical protein OHK0053_26880 [Microscillaceae bacterium]